MTIPLIQKLIDRGVIKDGTEVDVNYRALDLGRNPTVATSGTFIVRSIEGEGDALTFITQSGVDGQPRRILASAVVKIDGMDPVRLGQNFGLTEEGTRMPQGKRRGRKPKIPRQEDEF